MSPPLCLGRVLPVVSDFDCFLVGTRRVQYNMPLPPDQQKALHWCVNQIEKICERMLAEKTAENSNYSGDDNKPSQTRKEKTHISWSLLWLQVLRDSSFHPEIPRFGFGDPISYCMVENAVERLHLSGAVRHGPGKNL